MKRLLVDIKTAEPSPVLAALSQRELEVLQLLARRMSTTQMATAMSITVNTVRTRVRGASGSWARTDGRRRRRRPVISA
jgi:DNA-binding NarL/FixJ family response regulator